MGKTVTPSPVANVDTPMQRRRTLDLRHAVVISIAVMSPAASIFFNTIPQAGLVGAAIPLCYVIGFVIALLVANQYSEMSRELPSNGSAYTFVVEGLNASWGFLTGWVGLIAVMLAIPYSFLLMSANLQTLAYRWFGLNLHWSLWFVAAIGIVFALSYIGVRQSLGIDMILLIFEMGVCIILAIIVLFHAGSQGGLSMAPFGLSLLPKNGDLTVGIILAVLSFIGFETAAALGEETNNPHRNIPRAVFGSMMLVGTFFVLMAYTATIGYGIDKMATGYANNPAPFDTIARNVSGTFFVVLIDLAGVLSFFGAALAIVNGGARIIYTVARDGLLPGWLAKVHPTRHTPIGAIGMLCGLGLVIGLALGFLMTPIGAFGFLGVLDTLFILLIYGLVNVSCVRFFWCKRKTQFHLVRHGIFPTLATLIIGSIFLATFASPGPAPLSYTPYVAVVWMVIGVGLLFAMRGKFISL
jgi:amino acid transporter